MAKRWMPNAALCRIDFRAAPPILAPGTGDRGMFEAYFYYFAPGSGPNPWKGLLASANLTHGAASLVLLSTKFDSNPPAPTAAPTTLADPIEALRRLKLPPVEFLKSGVHLKAAGSPFTTAINFGLTNGLFERYIDRTLAAGQWVWWTEFFPGNGENQSVYIDAVTGQGTIVPRVR